jgi:hypothetical protein
MRNTSNNPMVLEVQLDKARRRLSKYKPGGGAHTFCLGTIASLETRIDAMQEAAIEAYANIIAEADLLKG